MTTNSEAILSATGLTRRVGSGERELTILDAIDLAVAPAEAVAIAGPSGSGKSTLLGLLAGLDVPSTGDVHLFGESLVDRDEDTRAGLRAGRVGFVFQDFQLVPGLTALENVQLALELADGGDSRERALAALDEMGLAERWRHRPNELSGGEQQRVALARAFAPDPALLFADEPTGNLDAATGRAVVDRLFELRAARGTSLVLVTHDDAIARRCDRRIDMHAGRLVMPA